jgi:hypothetical protein
MPLFASSQLDLPEKDIDKRSVLGRDCSRCLGGPGIQCSMVLETLAARALSGR